MKSSILIYQSHNTFEADIVISVLDDHGIPFHVTGRADAGLLSILPVQVYIPADFKQEAIDLLREHLNL